MIDLTMLNDRQLDAANWQDGPLLVLAGPGSGKTKVLTSRIARMIEASPSEHFRILALTFTNKAASEMRQRIDSLVPGKGSRFLLTTFHSFAGDIVRQHGHLVGLKPDFTIVTQDSERAALLDDAIANLGLGNDDFQLTGEKLLPLINRMTENDVSDSELEKTMAAVPEGQKSTIHSIYKSYRETLIYNNCLDFPSLISQAFQVFRDVPAARKQLQRIYQFICVDEFQDTNLAQYSLLRFLVDDTKRNLFVVADDDQIIYQWNGASPERLRQLRDDYDMSLIELPANYRCPPQVIDIANRLIAHNTSRTAEKQSLLALKPAVTTESIRVYRFPDVDSEAAWIASDIAVRPETEKARCVVLARTRKMLEKAMEHLEAADVPAYLAMRKDEFVSAPMRFMHASLRLANNPQDREQVRRLCKAFYSLEGLLIDSKAVSSTAEAFAGNALRSFASLALSRAEVDSKTREFLTSSLALLTDRLDFRSYTRAAFGWFEDIADLMPEDDDNFLEYNEEKATWQQLVEEIEGQFSAEQVTLNVLLQELDMRSKAAKPPEGAVPCFTVHASKGLEFGHVYLMGMVEDQMPSWAAVKKGADSREMQEERRMCFVAITRTEDTLTMTFSQRVFGWNKSPSRFLAEMAVTGD